MSIQAGIWNFDGRPVESWLIAQCQASLKQQGPDGESYWLGGSTALLYRPFYTTTESRRENQPYISRRGFVLTWDGRLDNRQALSGELRDSLDARPTDIEIVAAAFDRWETGCFGRIMGDFAVSIWRPQEHELVFSVDYMAVRHIFYYAKERCIWWSTDLAPLVLLSGDTFHIDDSYIAGYFAYDPDAHLTPYREIREVPPGQFVRIRNGSASVERHWQFNPHSRIRYSTDAEYEEHFRHVFRQAVRRRLRSDSPILAELSGGLDSSSVVCVADDILAKESAETPRLDTISYYDKTEPKGDDWIYFRKIEETRGRVGAHVDLNQVGVNLSMESLEFCPLPGRLGDKACADVERADVLRNGGYRVVLSGIGGDEFQGGIPDPTPQLSDLIMKFRFITLAQQLIAWSLVKRRSMVHLLGQALICLLPASLGQYLVRRARIDPWIDQGFAKRTRLRIRLIDVDEHFGFWLPSRRSRMSGVVMMANKLAKSDSPTSTPEEDRYPYLDQDLIEFILSIPADQILRPGERRSLMRRSLRGLVPQYILCRQTKQVSQRTPILMLEKNWEKLGPTLNCCMSSALGYLNGDRFLEMLRAGRSGSAIHIVRAMRGISLELWLQELVSRHLIDICGSSNNTL